MWSAGLFRHYDKNTSRLPVPGEWRKAPGQIQFLQCRDSPESHIIKLGVVTLRQHRCTTPHKPIAQGNVNLPGFYAESHLRVLKSCSWFPIDHLPHTTENLRIRAACLFPAKQNKPAPFKSLPVIKTTPWKNWVLNVEKNKGGTTRLLLRLSTCTHRPNYALKIPPESLLIIWPLFQLKIMKSSVHGLQGL